MSILELVLKFVVVVVECEFSVLLWSKPLLFKLKVCIWTNANNLFEIGASCAEFFDWTYSKADQNLLDFNFPNII